MCKKIFDLDTQKNIWSWRTSQYPIRAWKVRTVRKSVLIIFYTDYKRIIDLFIQHEILNHVKGCLRIKKIARSILNLTLKDLRDFMLFKKVPKNFTQDLKDFIGRPIILRDFKLFYKVARNLKKFQHFKGFWRIL